VFKKGGWLAHGEGTGNQIIDEINAWLKYKDTAYVDFLCPVLKFYTCKSDKVTAISPKMLEKCLIVAQRAYHIGNLHEACVSAEMENRKHGIRRGQTASEREKAMIAFAKMNAWRDVRNNPANCGVVYDYEKRCYKAVFVDYAL
jgi:hypothetical protein